MPILQKRKLRHSFSNLLKSTQWVGESQDANTGQLIEIQKKDEAIK